MNFEEFTGSEINEGWKEALLAGAILLSTTGKGASKTIDVTKNDADTTLSSKKIGTSVDGIIGEWTSKFIFPGSSFREIEKVIGKTVKDTTVNTGIEGNNLLMKKFSRIGAEDMKAWNDFVEWMKTKGYSGNPQMNHRKFSETVLAEYTADNPDFWVKDSNDVKIVQRVIKAYRADIIAKWKNTIIDDKGRMIGLKDKTIGEGYVKINDKCILWSPQAEAMFMAWAR